MFFFKTKVNKVRIASTSVHKFVANLGKRKDLHLKAL